jgi:CRP-like cAMP-binding protein/ActR/RegA family two-component response regulator
MPKIVVIEDQLEVRENICEILELANHEVYSAPNGKAGIELVKSEQPDLVICDIMMPELDGYGVLFMLAKNPKTASIPFIFLSAKSEKEDFRKGMAMGADDYLTKPFKELDLLDAIDSRLKKSAALKTIGGDIQEMGNFLRNQNNLGELKNLAAEARTKIIDRKEVLYHAGDMPSFIFYVLEGKVRTYAVNHDGKELSVALYGPGDYFGFTELLQEKEYSEYASALEYSKLALISKDDFFGLILSNREIASSFMSQLAKNISTKEQELVQMAYDTVRKRVARALVKLYDTYHVEKKAGFSVTISRDELASIVGTATESVIRILSEFKADNWIYVRGSHIEILDIEPLRNYKY